MANTARKNEQRKKRVVRKPPTLTRTKSLLLAALRVWELKNGLNPRDTEFQQ